MLRAYSKFEHTAVVVAHPTMTEPWEGPFDIVLHTGEHVWVPASYSHEGHPEVLRVGIGGSVAADHDEDGNCILAVPAAWCNFLTPEEAEACARVADAEAKAYSS